MVRFITDSPHQIITTGDYENILEQNERTIYLGNLDLNTKEAQIDELFNVIGLITQKVVKQPFSSFAHVTFESLTVVKFLLEKSNLIMSNKILQVMPFNQTNNFEPNANLIIKNLESFLNEFDIIEKFSLYGEILSCKLVRGSKGIFIRIAMRIQTFFPNDELNQINIYFKGESKCYAYLQYKEKSSALDCIDNLNNTYWDEKYDPDFHYQRYKEKMQLFKKKQHINHFIDFTDRNDPFNEINKKSVHGKKIYVGIFKKKDEYFRIKKEKEGKPSNLYVKNFGPNFGDRDLFNLFKTFGSIKSAKVRRQKFGLVEKPLGCGFVDFEEPEEAEKARIHLNGYVLKNSGRVISVTYADCKSRRMRKRLEEEKLNDISDFSPKSNECTQLSDYESKISDSETVSNSSFDSIPTDWDYPLNNSCELAFNWMEDSRNRSISTSSDSSFDSILLDWSEMWNRKVNSEYKLF